MIPERGPQIAFSFGLSRLLYATLGYSRLLAAPGEAGKQVCVG